MDTVAENHGMKLHMWIFPVASRSSMEKNRIDAITRLRHEEGDFYSIEKGISFTVKGPVGFTPSKTGLSTLLLPGDSHTCFGNLKKKRCWIFLLNSSVISFFYILSRHIKIGRCRKSTFFSTKLALGFLPDACFSVIQQLCNGAGEGSRSQVL